MKTGVSIKLAGESYRNGWRNPGFGLVLCNDGTSVYVPESEAIGFDGCVRYAERKGVCMDEVKARLDEWVKTGNGVSFSLK